jgi:hypothetical protein
MSSFFSVKLRVEACRGVKDPRRGRRNMPPVVIHIPILFLPFVFRITSLFA